MSGQILESGIEALRSNRYKDKIQVGAGTGVDESEIFDLFVR